jgi:plastocyanin
VRRVATILTAVVLVVLGTATVASAGGGGHGSPCRAFGEGTTLVMRDSCVEAIAHTVTVGTTLTVRNDGALPHTITAIDGTFDSGHIGPGGTYELTLGAPGPVPVYCTLHGSAAGDGMAGLLQVTAADGAAQEAATAWAAGGVGSSVTALVAALLGLAVGIPVGRRTREQVAR